MNLEFDVMGKYVARLLDAQLSARAWPEGEVLPEIHPAHGVVGRELFGASLFQNLPSNKRYARSVMCRVSCTLWSVMSTPMPLCLN